jgi:hypothetical protein
MSAFAVRTARLLLVSFAFVASHANANDVHPLMNSKYWGSIGAFFATSDFKAIAQGEVGGGETRVDFESSLGLDDRPDLLDLEFGWQFGEKWDLSLQYFFADRERRKTLDKAIVWEGVIFDLGVDITAKSDIEVTRIFFSRDVWNSERHDLRLGAGVHYIKLNAEIGGEAVLDDGSTEFRVSDVSAAFPVPDIGAWYRFSPSDRWILNARLDWFSANVGDYSGSLWNFAVGANFRLNTNVGIGLSYQLFELNGTIRETDWKGDARTRFAGPQIYLAGFW